ncbi:hypothetical protein ACFO4E_16300 [Nocardiopsis mangrovi]|uniref:IraD/Gp25-like domain-containing protein n=1 Tax=Nocardiopsis mangrovi TaxID=1179818 RepID=A0ABV9DY90_9ACTN
MAEQTEITFGYLRRFRDENIQGMLTDLRDQRDRLNAYVDDEVSKDKPPINGIHFGNPEVFPQAGNLGVTLNNNVRLIREQLNGLIKEFEGLDYRLEKVHIRFENTEDDQVVTAQELAYIIDPENVAQARNTLGDDSGEDAG